MVDHLSRHEISNEEQGEIDEEFPDEEILSITSHTLISSISKITWFANYANFLVGDFLLKDLTYQQNNSFLKLSIIFWMILTCTCFVLTK